MTELDLLLEKSKKASAKFSYLDAKKRSKCLENIKSAILENKSDILKANAVDLKNAVDSNISQSMQDRLKLDDVRVEALAKSIDAVIALNEVVGVDIENIKRPNGLTIIKRSVPFGVVAVIFESRPNVCVDIATLCIKTANVCVFKGGKEAFNTNKELVRIMRKAVSSITDENIITLIEDNSRETVAELITKSQYIDLLLPRGGKGLIKNIVENAKVPYIQTGAGNCNLYVHKAAKLDMSLKIAVNAKYSRPSVCNSIENILVDEDVADKFLPMLYKEFNNLGIEMRGCEKTCKTIDVKKANEDDYYKEYNDYIVAIKVVSSLDEAIDFINKHSTSHSECIVTEDSDARDEFFARIDSACVYNNASTRFSDGGEFGFGAELGISTQKMHARGPMGIREMTSYKYIIYGNGQTRG